MNVRGSLAILILTVSAASAAAADVKTYTPEIHGMLTSGKQPIASNVCLRQSDSEIRSCGYADGSGRFFIPAIGPLHPATPPIDGAPPPKLSYWLETGNVQHPQKLWPIEIVTTPYEAVDLACDMAQSARADATFRACEMKTSKQLVDHTPRDDSRYRMARPAEKPVEKSDR